MQPKQSEQNNTQKKQSVFSVRKNSAVEIEAQVEEEKKLVRRGSMPREKTRSSADPTPVKRHMTMLDGSYNNKETSKKSRISTVENDSEVYGSDEKVKEYQKKEDNFLAEEEEDLSGSQYSDKDDHPDAKKNNDEDGYAEIGPEAQSRSLNSDNHEVHGQNSIAEDNPDHSFPTNKVMPAQNSIQNSNELIKPNKGQDNGGELEGEQDEVPSDPHADMNGEKLGSRRLTQNGRAKGEFIGDKMNRSARKVIDKNVIDRIDESNFHGHTSRICMIPPENRKNLDQDILVKATSFLTFFQNMNKKKVNIEFNTHFRCCKHLMLRNYRIGQCVLEYGDIPDNFYIILSGSCSVYFPRDGAKREADKEAIKLLGKVMKNVPLLEKFAFKKYATTDNGFSDDMIESARTFSKIKGNNVEYLEDHLEKMLGKIKEADLVKHKALFDDDGVLRMSYVGTIPRGAHFGDLGLTEKALRKATIICNEKSELAYMGKEDFLKVLGEVSKMGNDKKKKFYCHQVFKNAFDLDLAGSIGNFWDKKIKLNRNNHIYKQGEVPKSAYIVKKGSIMIYQKKEEEIITTEAQAKVNEMARKIPRMKQVNLAILEEGEIFGEEEIIKGCNRICSAVMMEETIILEITKNNFAQLCKDFRIFNEHMKKLVQDKAKSRKDTCKKSSTIGGHFWSTKVSTDYHKVGNPNLKKVHIDWSDQRNHVTIQDYVAKHRKTDIITNSDGLFNINMDINNNLFINNNQPETIELKKQYNENSSLLGALDVSKYQRDVKIKCSGLGQKWYSKVKRMKNFEELDEVNADQNAKYVKKDVQEIIDDLTHMRDTNTNGFRKSQMVKNPAGSIITANSKKFDNMSKIGHFTTNHNNKTADDDRLELNSVDNGSTYGKKSRSPQHLIHQINTELEIKKRNQRDILMSIRNEELAAFNEKKQNGESSYIDKDMSKVYGKLNSNSIHQDILKMNMRLTGPDNFPAKVGTDKMGNSQEIFVGHPNYTNDVTSPLSQKFDKEESANYTDINHMDNTPRNDPSFVCKTNDSYRKTVHTSQMDENMIPNDQTLQQNEKHSGIHMKNHNSTISLPHIGKFNKHNIVPNNKSINRANRGSYTSRMSQQKPNPLIPSNEQPKRSSFKALDKQQAIDILNYDNSMSNSKTIKGSVKYNENYFTNIKSDNGRDTPQGHMQQDNFFPRSDKDNQQGEYDDNGKLDKQDLDMGANGQDFIGINIYNRPDEKDSDQKVQSVIPEINGTQLSMDAPPSIKPMDYKDSILKKSSSPINEENEMLVNRVSPDNKVNSMNHDLMVPQIGNSNDMAALKHTDEKVQKMTRKKEKIRHRNGSPRNNRTTHSPNNKCKQFSPQKSPQNRSNIVHGSDMILNGQSLYGETPAFYKNKSPNIDEIPYYSLISEIEGPMHTFEDKIIKPEVKKSSKSQKRKAKPNFNPNKSIDGINHSQATNIMIASSRIQYNSSILETITKNRNLLTNIHAKPYNLDPLYKPSHKIHMSSKHNMFRFTPANNIFLERYKKRGLSIENVSTYKCKNIHLTAR